MGEVRILSSQEASGRLSRLIDSTKFGTVEITQHRLEKSDMRSEHTFVVYPANYAYADKSPGVKQVNNEWIFSPLRTNNVKEAEGLLNDINQGIVSVREGSITSDDTGYLLIIVVTDARSVGYGVYEQGGSPRF